MSDELQRERERALDLLRKAVQIMRERRDVSKRIANIKRSSGLGLEDYERELEMLSVLRPSREEHALINLLLLDSLRAQGLELRGGDFSIERIRCRTSVKLMEVERIRDRLGVDHAFVLGSRKQVFIAWLHSLRSRAIALIEPIGRSWDMIAWSLLVRPYRLSQEGYDGRLPAFAQSPNRFGVLLRTLSPPGPSSLVDVTYSSDKSPRGEAIFMYSPACLAGTASEVSIVYSNNREELMRLVRAYEIIFGPPDRRAPVSDEGWLRSESERRAAQLRGSLINNWEDGPFVAVRRRVHGGADASLFGNYSGAYVVNLLR
ncbi:MAG: hypothetical protein ACP5LW_03440 [Nitrososphaeria archaeon]